MADSHGQGSAGRNASPSRRGADVLLGRAIWRTGPWLVVHLSVSVLLAVASVVLPAVLGRGVDAVLGRASHTWLTWAALLVGSMVALDALEDLATGATTARSTAWLRHTVTGHLLELGTQAERQFAPGDIASRLTGNAADTGRVAPDAVRAVGNLLPAIGAVVALGLIDPWLCVTFLAGVPVLAVLLRAFARDASDIATRYLTVQAGITARLVDALSGARTIAAAGTTERETERVLAPLPELHDHGVEMWRAQIKISWQDAVVVTLLEIAVLAVAGARLAAGRISPGDMFAAGQYVILGASLGSVNTTLNRFARDRAAARRLDEVLAEPPMRYGKSRLRRGRGQIEFRGVTASSGERVVLDRLDLVVPAGTVVAVVGASGSGKSMLAALAGRLVDPDAGSVTVDGVDVTSLSRRALRRAVTYGFERPALMGESLADVIGLGVFRPDDDRLVAAARAAQADGFVRRLPHGYLTRLDDAPMSGGEAQRLGLARTFAHAGRLMILDDVAASLDTVTEHEIGRVVSGALAGRTRMVVAHRASTAARADHVVWLEGGQVRAMAPHRVLWEQPEYRALFGVAAPPASVSSGSLSGAGAVEGAAVEGGAVEGADVGGVA